MKNAVVDDEIRAWVNNIRNTGAFVWLVIDACQSGTMARGAEVERQIPMSELVPQAAIDAAISHSARRGTADADALLGWSDSAGDVAALYAAQMTETTPERPLPNANSPVHGLFSYTIADILSQSTTALTYRELALRVIEQYRAMPRATRRRRSSRAVDSIDKSSASGRGQSGRRCFSPSEQPEESGRSAPVPCTA